MSRSLKLFAMVFTVLLLTVPGFSAEGDPVELFDLYIHSYFGESTVGVEAHGFAALSRAYGTPEIHMLESGTFWAILDLVNEKPYYTSWHSELTPSEPGIIPYGSWEMEDFQTQELTTPISTKTHIYHWDLVHELNN